MRRVLIVSCIASVFYFFLWMWLATPYRPFPSDPLEIMMYLDMTGEGGFLKQAAELLRQYNPMFLLALNAFRNIWKVFYEGTLSSFVLMMVLSNSAIIVLSAMVTYRITSSTAAALVSALLFGVSAWPVTYHFLPWYAVFSTALFTASIVFLLEASLGRRRKWPFIACSAALSGLLIWSSSSALLVVSLQAVLVFILFDPLRPPWSRENMGNLAVYALVFAAVFLPFLPGSAGPLFEHIKVNAASSHVVDAVLKFGYAPEAPFFSFFHIGAVYSPVLFGSFAVVSVLYAALKVSAAAGRVEGWREPFEKRQGFMLVALVTLVWAHLLLVDLLPFTKLARTHYAVYPLMLSATVGMALSVARGFGGRLLKLKPALYFVFTVLLGIVVYENIAVSRKTMYVRTYTPARISEISRDMGLYVLKEDPHAGGISYWLWGAGIKEIGVMDVDRLAARSGGKGRVGVLVGPTGKGSGMSVLGRAVMPDIDIEIKGEPYEVLPYYAYYPPFLMEEEVSQALYFEGRMPDYKDPKKNIRLFVF